MLKNYLSCPKNKILNYLHTQRFICFFGSPLMFFVSKCLDNHNPWKRNLGKQTSHQQMDTIAIIDKNRTRTEAAIRTLTFFAQLNCKVNFSV